MKPFSFSVSEKLLKITTLTLVTIGSFQPGHSVLMYIAQSYLEYLVQLALTHLKE
jgi:hypothetical protein